MKNILKLTLISLTLFAEEKPTAKSIAPQIPDSLRAEWRKSQALAANAAIEYLLAEKKFNANNATYQKSIESAESKMRKSCEDAKFDYVINQETQEPGCVERKIQRSSAEGKK